MSLLIDLLCSIFKIIGLPLIKKRYIDADRISGAFAAKKRGCERSAQRLVVNLRKAIKINSTKKIEKIKLVPGLKMVL